MRSSLRAAALLAACLVALGGAAGDGRAADERASGERRADAKAPEGAAGDAKAGDGAAAGASSTTLQAERASEVPGDRNGDGQVVIACLGDSNTDAGWQSSRKGGFPREQGWCERLPGLLGESVTVVNFGTGGATAVRNGLPSVPDMGVFFDGFRQIEDMLQRHCVDVVLAAFGTNDVEEYAGGTPEKIVEAYRDLYERVRANGAYALVATTPRPLKRGRRYRRPLDATERTSELVRKSFPAEHVLDFEAILEPDDYMDDLHMNASGHAKRAQEAARKLSALFASEPEGAGYGRLVWASGRWSRGCGIGASVIGTRAGWKGSRDEAGEPRALDYGPYATVRWAGEEQLRVAGRARLEAKREQREAKARRQQGSAPEPAGKAPGDASSPPGARSHGAGVASHLEGDAAAP